MADASCCDRSARSRVALTAVVAVVVAALLAGAAMGDRSAEPKRRIAVVLQAEGCPPARTVELCEGIRRAMRLTGVRARVVTPTLRESMADFLALTAQQGYDAVVLAGVGLGPEVVDVARRYPEVPFISFDASRSEAKRPPANVQGLMIHARHAAFLAGWLAAKLEAARPGRDVVGVVGGYEAPPVTDFVDGFVAGARRAVPRVKLLVDYSGNFDDQSRCAALARRQIARGAGTVFNVAGFCGLGTMKAAAEGGVWAVGVDSDQSFLGPHVLTSVLKNYEAGFVDVFRQVKAGKVRTGRDTILTMRDGAAGLGRISPRVPRRLVRELEALERRIVSGELRLASASGGQELRSGSAATATHTSPS